MGQYTLHVETVPIDEVSQDPVNARRHPPRNIESIKASLRDFGQTKPIVVDTNSIIRAGNGTHVAAKALGWTEIAIVRVPLEGARAIAYAIADNRTGELAEWDFENLAALLRGLQEEEYPIADLGWEEYELAPILEAEWSPPAAGDNLPSSEGMRQMIIVISAQYADTVAAALAEVKKEQPDAKDGQAIGMICAAFLESSNQAQGLPATDSEDADHGE